MRHVLVVLIAASILSGASARADDIAVGHDPKKAFQEADQNHDGVVDPAEFYERVTEVFYAGDVDRDGFLSPAELDAAVVIHTDFESVDINRDGKTSLVEFLQERSRTFEQVDTNADSLLSEDEVVTGFKPVGPK